MRPKLILFDYGNTLMHEPDFDALRGEHAIFNYIKSNPLGVTAEEAVEFAQKISADTLAARKLGVEPHEWQYLRLMYDYLQIEFTLPLHEIENIFWDNASPGALMPDALEMLISLKEENIRSAVISNIVFSGAALKRRIDAFLPGNQFEFIIASSEYLFRKPSPYLFELALRKARVSADETWFCGDNPRADVEGASSVGIYPIWYKCLTIDNPWADKHAPPPSCAHTLIHEWHELIDMLKAL